ncbi:hypothetical protein [Allokutzneria sp. NRRL B-24872]|uniref:hypothetical protein n=1 Tax=Allokutzneria sp. NRRL B-24872 TaxID=1137961 RepID=UPI000A38EFCC|nr:hypothetical protein [Allokutzneria sp. NRRL B-24872]
MRTTDTSTAAIGIALSLVLAIGAGSSAGWPIWLIMLAALVLLAVTAWVVRQQRSRREEHELRVEHARNVYEQEARPTPPPPPPPGERRIDSVTLSSATPDYPFVFSCTVRWRPQHHAAGNGHADPGALAAEAIVLRARQITTAHAPEDDTTATALAAALGHAVSDPRQHVIAWATQVSLKVSQEDREHLSRASAVRKHIRLWEQEKAVEQAKRRYYADDVLASTGSTVVWWLARDAARVQETVELVGTLAQLSAAARDTHVDDAFQHLLPEDLRRPTPPAPELVDAAQYNEDDSRQGVPGQMTAFIVDGDGVVTNHADVIGGQPVPRIDEELLPDPENSENSLFGHHLADLLDQHEHHDRAHRTRDRYGVEDLDAADEDFSPVGDVDVTHPLDDEAPETSTSADVEDPPPPAPDDDK